MLLRHKDKKLQSDTDHPGIQSSEETIHGSENVKYSVFVCVSGHRSPVASDGLHQILAKERGIHCNVCGTCCFVFLLFCQYTGPVKDVSLTVWMNC